MSEQPTILNPPSYATENNWDFKKILSQLSQRVGLILFCGLCGFIYIFFKTISTPQEYQSSALIQTFDKAAGGGNSAPSTNLISALGLSRGANPVKSELTLLRTRYVLEPVILENKLHVFAKPVYFPLLGLWKAGHYSGAGSSKAFLGLKKYAWGGEEIKLIDFTVPNEYVGKEFRLVAEKNDQFKLFFLKGDLILTGTVGHEASSVRYPGLSINISKLKARPGTEFDVIYQSPLWLSLKLASKLSIYTVPFDVSTRDTGVMEISFRGEDPEKIETTLNAVVDYLIKVNIQNKSRDAKKTWEFLKTRLPKLKEGVEQSEEEANHYLVKHHTLNSAQTGQLLMIRCVKLEQSIEMLKEKREKLLQIYTPQYPLIIALNTQEEYLKKKYQDIDRQLKDFYTTYRPQFNLEREIKLKDSLYLATLNNMQQLELVQAGLTSDIVALGKALPASPIPSRRLRKLISGFVVGCCLGATYILVRNALREPIENSEQLEERLSLPVRAIISYSRKQKRLGQKNKRMIDVSLHSSPILVKQAPDDIVAESFRSLRVSLGIMNSLKGHQVIAMMGGMAGVGKSFVSLNLTQIFAESGKRTLLIDADLRRGYLYEVLSKSKEPGLSEFLEEKITAIDEIIQPIHDNFYFISCGHFKKQPTELLHKSHFQSLIKKLKDQFDQIIIDTPPVLLVSDSMLIAPWCDVKLYVVGVPTDDMQSVQRAINRLRTHGVDVDGLILNYRQALSGRGLVGGYYRRYDYQPRERKEVATS